MTDPDRRPFWQRHPALLAALVAIAALAVVSLVMFVRVNLRENQFTGKPPEWQNNMWTALLCPSSTGLVVLLTIAWRRRLGRPPDWLCGRCGYDRRGVPDLSPCPECGAPSTGD